MSQIWLIDFDDSFTYNIVSEFHLLDMDCRVIHWKEWQHPTTRLPKLLILGPGPGHPDEYGIEDLVLSWWKTQIPMAGICLGHQFLARFLGLPVSPSVRPLHGEAIKLNVPEWWRQKFHFPSQVEVQRYNSLAVPAKPLPREWRGWESEGEWMAFHHERALSYQFHPESVGTSCPESFFLPLCRLAL
jgi:anthranilate/para-aminobenzoate synthase component II